MSSCMTHDFLTFSRIKSGKTDFFYSPTQFEKEGFTGYCRIWVKEIGNYRVFPYTYKCSQELDNEYFMYQDWIYVGRGNEVTDFHFTEDVVCPSNRNELLKVKTKN